MQTTKRIEIINISAKGEEFTFEDKVLEIVDNKGGIVGVTREDANKVKEDMKAIFKDDKFSNFLDFITLDEGGKRFNFIDDVLLSKLMDYSRLNDDEKVLMEIVINTFNSESEHLIEYVDKGRVVSKTGQEIMTKNLPSALDIPLIIEKNGGIPASIIATFAGEGATVKTNNGTYTLMIEGLGSSANSDYYNKDTNSYINNPAIRPTTSGHEIFGHGRPLTLGRDSSQHIDAIRMENLILRVMGYKNVQRDGTNHDNRTMVTDPSKLPDFR